MFNQLPHLSSCLQYFFRERKKEHFVLMDLFRLITVSGNGKDICYVDGLIVNEMY